MLVVSLHDKFGNFKQNRKTYSARQCQLYGQTNRDSPRYGIPEIERHTQRPSSAMLVVSVHDKFGDLNKTGKPTLLDNVNYIDRQIGTDRETEFQK